ncbi:hypothetical protein [Adhaeribacter radiodurans]|uniref:Uncharacterized protein n=1 Tax=Adhaeribacter radiodurans TaxID=2745197 RepID=A0A7L7LFK6_9BACT|nr:hypothetical protein [Adhaeribacter radiodurans]QMU31169.1 hypothetical protein HUW48_25475 [Adhaeribacter radiodurans]
MTFEEIYSKILPLWGDKIDFSDGYIIQPERKYKNLKKVTDSKDYFYSKNLSNQWNALEEQIAEDDAEGRLMLWTMFQVFQQHARKKFEQNVLTFLPGEIYKTEIEEQFLKNV